MHELSGKIQPVLDPNSMETHGSSRFMAVKPLYSRHQQCNASPIQEHQKSFSLISILMSAGILFDREIILLWLQT